MVQPPNESYAENAVQHFTPTTQDLVQRSDSAGMSKVHANLGLLRMDTRERTDWNPDDPQIYHSRHVLSPQFAEARRKMDIMRHTAYSKAYQKESTDPYRVRNAEHTPGAAYLREGPNASATDTPGEN